MAYYKCKTSKGYVSFKKGDIYEENSIRKYLIIYPEDWKKLEDKPTEQELIECIKTGKNKTKIIKILKSWKQ